LLYRGRGSRLIRCCTHAENVARTTTSSSRIRFVAEIVATAFYTKSVPNGWSSLRHANLALPTLKVSCSLSSSTSLFQRPTSNKHHPCSCIQFPGHFHCITWRTVELDFVDNKLLSVGLLVVDDFVNFFDDFKLTANVIGQLRTHTHTKH